MGQRITRADVDYVFSQLVDQARNRNIDVSGWSFGQHFGHLYHIVDESDDNQIIHGNWLTKREAYEGILHMSAGLTLVPLYAVVE